MPLFGASRAIIVAVLAALIAVAPLPSWAQAYPSRPVQLVVGYAQGGTGDFIARVIAEKLTAALGQPVTVENRPGASGTSAAQSVARAAPVDRIFGVPGEENLDVVEYLRTSSIELVLTRHEQGAAFMAATHGRLTGRPGVCIATLGPGALDFSTGAAYAHLGAMPMIMITGQKPIMRRRRPASRSST